MAQILSFRTPELRSNPPSNHHDHSAEVIVFPGVRYEHWGKEVAPATHDDQPAHRDVIELADQ